MIPCSRPFGLIFVLLLVLAACSGGDAPTESTPGGATPDPAEQAEVARVLATFATYRAGVGQGDGAAVVDSVTQASLDDQARIAELARTADEATLRALPAADQLSALTYRLNPELLDEDDPFRAAVDAGFGGQDRSLGEMGDVQLASETVAVGEVLQGQTGATTPLRWRFVLEDGQWRFDLVDANRLVSQAIANGARTSQVSVDDLVAATLQDLSGQSADVIQDLYATTP